MPTTANRQVEAAVAASSEGASEPFVGPPRHDEWALPDGCVISRTATVVPPPAKDRLRLQYAFRWRDADGADRSETVRFELNTWMPAFYAELARDAGFALVHLDERTFSDRRGRERAWAFFELRRV